MRNYENVVLLKNFYPISLLIATICEKLVFAIAFLSKSDFKGLKMNNRYFNIQLALH